MEKVDNDHVFQKSLNSTNAVRSRMHISNYAGFEARTTRCEPVLDTHIDLVAAKKYAARRDQLLRTGLFPGQINCCGVPVTKLVTFAVAFAGNLIPYLGASTPALTGIVSAPAGSTFFEVVHVRGYNYALLDTSYLTDLPVGCYFKRGTDVHVAMSMGEVLDCRIGLELCSVHVLPVLPVSLVDKCTDSFGYFCGGQFYLGCSDEVKTFISELFRTEQYGKYSSDSILPFDVSFELPFSQAHYCVRDCDVNRGTMGVVCDHARGPTTFRALFASRHSGLSISEVASPCIVCGKTALPGFNFLGPGMGFKFVGDISPLRVTSRLLPCDIGFSPPLSTLVRTRFFDPQKLKSFFGLSGVRVKFEILPNSDLVLALRAASVPMHFDDVVPSNNLLMLYIVYNKRDRNKFYHDMNELDEGQHRKAVFIFVQKKSDLKVMSLFDSFYAGCSSAKSLFEDYDQIKGDKPFEVGFGLRASYYSPVDVSVSKADLLVSTDDRIWAFVARHMGQPVHQFAIVNNFAGTVAKSTVKRVLNQLVLSGKLEHNINHTGSFYSCKANWSEIKDRLV